MRAQGGVVADQRAAGGDGDHAGRRVGRFVLRHAADRPPARAPDDARRSQPQGLPAAAADSERSELARSRHAGHARHRERSAVSAGGLVHPLQRIRRDLEDALRREAELGAGSRTPEQRQYLVDALAQFWDASDRIFALARGGHEAEARAEIRLSLQARQAALGTAVARLLVENNESEEETAARVQGIYNQVERQVYGFLAATLAAIVITSLYLIRSNRRLFARLASLSRERRDVAQQLITARESTLRHLARELHDEFGQTLTAMGSMLGRAERQAPADSTLRTDVREVAEIAQRMLEHVRSLAQTLHPSILEAVGLEGTIEWYLSTVERQTGIAVAYDRTGLPVPVDVTVGTHVYRILQEALNNVARHSASTQAWVRLRVTATALELDIEDHGAGMPAAAPRRGLGLVTMRERAALIGGSLEYLRPGEGGTLVRLRVPLARQPGEVRRAG